MNATSEDIKDMLEAETGLDLVFGENLFISREPSNPNNTVTIFDTIGRPDQLTFNRSERYEYPSVQIRVRNTRSGDAWDIIEKIKVALHGRAHETWNDTYYSVIHCISGPAMLDWDDNGRIRLIINFNVQRR